MAGVIQQITQLLLQLREVLTFPLVVHGFLLVGMSTFVAAVLQYEIDLPVLVAFPMAVSIAMLGYGVSWLSNFMVDVPMLWSLAGQGGLLVMVALLYEGVS